MDTLDFDHYISVSTFGDLSSQMGAVRMMISRFSKHYNEKAYPIFIDRFPRKLYDEFESMIADPKNVERYFEKKKLFFDVFTFIFRNQNLELLSDRKAEKFVLLFVKFIKIQDPTPAFDPRIMISSVVACASQEPYKVFFINENVIIHFYCYADISNSKSIENYFYMCRNIYDLKHINIGLCPIKLTETVDQLMTKFETTNEEDWARMLFKILRMLRRLKFLDEIEFSVTRFYDITQEMFTRYIKKGETPHFILSLSKIWRGILNGSKNSFRIDNIENLIFFARMFSVGISHHLHKIGLKDPDVDWCRDKPSMLYIVYLTLVAFPIIDHDKNPDLRRLLRRLHHSFVGYKNKYRIEENFPRNHFQFLQYYIKSMLTLDIPISILDEIFLNVQLNVLLKKSSYGTIIHSRGLHCCYLASQILINICGREDLCGSYFATGLGEAKTFMRSLIRSLSNEKYAHKIQKGQRLSFYEDLNIKHLSIINEDLIKSLFSKCESHLADIIKTELLEVHINTEYKIFTDIMANIIYSFNESNKLANIEADSYLRLCDEYPKNSFIITNIEDKSGDSLGATTDLNTSTNKSLLHRLPFSTLLRLFVLIYELKFIYGDINSKLTILFE
ncbi:hypothetical protein RF11_02786 [Thelohanellus kitauei]|uniref:Uncharacterized protein n=1 Tax=Thelohanellus kitauei TaxID=669202 RepID=A0A0C2N7F4_THEKT|nr:hypothetical protein RF11_02786 [Thelohanellus kitauei]